MQASIRWWSDVFFMPTPCWRYCLLVQDDQTCPLIPSIVIWIAHSLKRRPRPKGECRSALQPPPKAQKGAETLIGNDRPASEYGNCCTAAPARRRAALRWRQPPRAGLKLLLSCHERSHFLAGFTVTV